VSATPAAVKAELDKLAYLRRLDAHALDLSMHPAEPHRFLAGGYVLAAWARIDPQSVPGLAQAGYRLSIASYSAGALGAAAWSRSKSSR